MNEYHRDENHYMLGCIIGRRCQKIDKLISDFLRKKNLISITQLRKGGRIFLDEKEHRRLLSWAKYNVKQSRKELFDGDDDEYFHDIWGKFSDANDLTGGTYSNLIIRRSPKPGIRIEA